MSDSDYLLEVATILRMEDLDLSLSTMVLILKERGHSTYRAAEHLRKYLALEDGTAQGQRTASRAKAE